MDKAYENDFMELMQNMHRLEACHRMNADLDSQTADCLRDANKRMLQMYRENMALREMVENSNNTIASQKENISKLREENAYLLAFKEVKDSVSAEYVRLEEYKKVVLDEARCEADVIVEQAREEADKIMRQAQADFEKSMERRSQLKMSDIKSMSQQIFAAGSDVVQKVRIKIKQRHKTDLLKEDTEKVPIVL